MNRDIDNIFNKQFTKLFQCIQYIYSNLTIIFDNCIIILQNIIMIYFYVFHNFNFASACRYDFIFLYVFIHTIEMLFILLKECTPFRYARTYDLYAPIRARTCSYTHTYCIYNSLINFS